MKYSQCSSLISLITIPIYIHIDSMMITLLAATKPEWIERRPEPNN
jgi:hypothetical protein